MADRGRHSGRKGSDDALALLIAAGRTARVAAAELGIGERTVVRRLANPTFKAKVSNLRAEMISQSLGYLAEGMSSAAITLRLLLKAESDAIKLGSARAILEMGLKAREAVELEERLQALEEDLRKRAAT